MALTGFTVWEIRTTGSDTANGGGFDPSQTAGMFTDGAATSATGTAPVFSSASYNFVAGDVGAWVYVASGTNWTAGWYKISSVASNNATLNATIGQAVLSSQIPSTAAGCATTASPTSATWTIDYSQQAAAQFSYTDLASVGAGSAISSVAFPFAKQQVGNAIQITAGTNFTAGLYIISSVAAGIATVVGAAAPTTGVGAAGVGGLGGAFLSPGNAGKFHVAGNKFWILTGTYTVTSSSNNVAVGCLNITAQAANANQARVAGYGSVRGDRGTRPTIIASGISSFSLITTAVGNFIDNLILDGASLTTSRGCNNTGGTCYKVKAQNFTNTAISRGEAIICEVTGCSAVISLTADEAYGCYIHGNTFTGAGLGATSGVYTRCISANNTGASSNGFDGQFGALHLVDCIAYGNGLDGVRYNGAFGNSTGSMVNCISVANSGWQFNCSAAMDHPHLIGCAYGTTGSGGVSNFSAACNIGPVVLTGDPFVDGVNGNFALDNTSGEGSSCRATGVLGVFPGATTTGYSDIGAVQHQDSGSSGMLFIPNMEGT